MDISVTALDHACGPDCSCWTDNGKRLHVFNGGKAVTRNAHAPERPMEIVRKYAVAAGNK